jgi:hypothetical protein
MSGICSVMFAWVQSRSQSMPVRRLCSGMTLGKSNLFYPKWDKWRMRFYCLCSFRLLNSRGHTLTIDIFVWTDSHQNIVYKIVFYTFKGALNHTILLNYIQWKILKELYIHTYIRRLYLKHGKPSVILHNKYSLNYSKLKKTWIHIVYIQKYNKYETTVLPGCRVGVGQELNSIISF